MSDTEIKMEELSKQVTEIKTEYAKLREKYIEEVQNKLRPLVGMCFRDEHSMFRIIDVPDHEYDMYNHTLFNKYSLPVLAICDNITIYGDVGALALCVKYSKAVLSDDPAAYIRVEYEEMPAEEFDAELEKAFHNIRQLGKCGDVK